MVIFKLKTQRNLTFGYTKLRQTKKMSMVQDTATVNSDEQLKILWVDGLHTYLCKRNQKKN